MANPFYTASGEPGTGTFAASAPMRSEFQAIQNGFNLMPLLTAGTAIVVNGAGTALANTVGQLALAGNFATTGAFGTTLVQGATISLTLPVVSGTLATTANINTALPSATSSQIYIGTGAAGAAAVASTLPTAAFPALTGDVTTPSGSLATTLASVATAGTTGSSTAIPVITIDAKGRTTTITTAAVVAPAGTLTGTTLAAGVTASSLTSVGSLSSLTLSGALTYAGVTLSNNVSGTGSMVLSASPTFSVLITTPTVFSPAATNLSLLAATGQTTVIGLQGSPTSYLEVNGTQVFPSADNAMTLGTSGLKWSDLRTVTATLTGALTYGGVTLSNAVTGTGNMVLSASPTLSGTVGGALTFSGALTLSSALTYGGVALSNAVTGTGNMVLSASPTLSGTVAGTLSFSGALTLSSALTYGGVTLTNNVTGTGRMVLSASPTFSGTVVGPDGGQWTTAGLTAATLILAGGTGTYTAPLTVNGSDGNYAIDIENPGHRSWGIKLSGETLILGSNNSAAIILTATSSGGTQFNGVSTTASAANAFLDGANSNNLLRSTSSLVYKHDIETLQSDRADAFVDKARPIWYRSLAPADNPDWSWYGFSAEEMADIDPRLVAWGYQDRHYERDSEGQRVLRPDAVKVPDSVMYERTVVMLTDVVRRLRARMTALEAR